MWRIVVNKGEMRSKRRKRVLFVTSIAAMMCVALSIWGCGDGSVSRQEVEEIDTVFRKGASNLAATTAFINALEDFSFENVGFYDAAVNAVNKSYDAAQALRTSIEELGTFDYDGAMEPLGSYIEEYVVSTIEALDELEGVLAGLQDILQAIEPVLREEAVITQLEAPQNDAELYDRLGKLKAALAPCLDELAEIEVPTQLAEFKSFFIDLFGTLSRLVDDLMAAASGRIPATNPENNPDFLYMQALLEGYPSIVSNMYDELKITGIDPLVEKVELEINRLYLGEGDRSAVGRQ